MTEGGKAGRRQFLSYAIGVSLALAVALTGCDKPTDQVWIAGTVSYEGQPVDSAMLSFYPPKGRATAVPVTPGGKYEAQLSPGEYKVTVVEGVTLPEGWQEGDDPPPPTIGLPKQYRQRSRTPLTVSVSADQSAPIDLELEK